MTAPVLTVRRLADLRPAPGRTWQDQADLFARLAAHGDAEDADRVSALMSSIGEQGLRQPLAVDDGDVVADGAHRAVACFLLGLADVPCEPWDETVEYPSWYGA